MEKFILVYMICSRGEHDIDFIDTAYGDSLSSVIEVYEKEFPDDQWDGPPVDFAEDLSYNLTQTGEVGCIVTNEEGYLVILPKSNEWFKVFDREDELTDNEYNEWIDFCDSRVSQL